jgi:hypothetical protein
LLSQPLLPMLLWRPCILLRGRTMQHNKRREVALLIITKRASKQSCRRPFRRYIRLHIILYV